jgi:FkbM family methyltransferase
VPVEIAAGPYEPSLLDAIEHFATPDLPAYDVGANIGYVSLALAKAMGQAGRVVAFEPLPANLVRLRANMALNPEGSRVQVVGAAIGARNAQAAFMVHESGGMGKLQASEGRQTPYKDTITVEVISLDEWITDRGGAPPGLIKIDVEGGEAAVLEGLAGTLNRIRPTILIELHGPEATKAVQNVLAEAGYALHAARDGYPKLGEIAGWKTYAVALPSETGE